VKWGAGITLLQVVIFIAVLVVLAGMFFPALNNCREPAHRILCRNNLNQLAKGMATYLNEFGDNRWYSYPLGRGLRRYDYCGSEWLASLYWTGVVPDPGVFLCPKTKDTNNDGADLGEHRAPSTFGPSSVSYAGMHLYSMTDEKGSAIPAAIPHDFPANRPMASDDTEGDVNHGTADNGGMAVLFFDSHVEFRTNTELDLEHAVGQKGGLLERLRN